MLDFPELFVPASSVSGRISMVCSSAIDSNPATDSDVIASESGCPAVAVIGRILRADEVGDVADDSGERVVLEGVDGGDRRLPRSAARQRAAPLTGCYAARAAATQASMTF